MAKLEDFNTPLFPTWCAGCGDFSIWSALKGAFVTLGMEPHQCAVIYGIGCSGNMCSFVNTYGFEGLHGRGLPVACGIKMANHNLPVMMVGGDGDILGEGMGHFIHACRANHHVATLIHNNQVYGLTTGQTAPTSEKGAKTKSTPSGVIEEQTNPITLALTAGATFVARGFSGDIPHLTDLIVKALSHKGFAVLDVLQPCVTFNKINTYAWFRERVYKLEESGYRQTTKVAALERAFEPWGERLPLGIFWQEEKPTYEDSLPQLKNGPLVERDLSHIDISKFLEEFK